MYIVFEGIVGSGKTTQVKNLGKYLRGKYPDREIVVIREPGSTPIAEDIRYLAQGKQWEGEDMHPLTNAYLYAAARAQTLHTMVLPALERGAIVVSDRSFISSCAYQGEAQGLGIETVLSINSIIVGKVIPDIIFYMDIPIDTALIRTFDQEGDKWEKMDKIFFEKILIGYEKCEKIDFLKNKIYHIDANLSEETVFNKIKYSLTGITL